MVLKQRSGFLENQFHELLKGGQSVLFPSFCLHCNEKLSGEYQLCLTCWSKVKPYIAELDFRQMLKNRFIERLDTEQLFAAFWFQAESPIQSMLHALKYNQNRQCGIELGKRLGELIQSVMGENISAIDGILPIPIHPLKKIERGYNQAEVIANGIQTKLSVNVPIVDLLSKQKFAVSQTKKSRTQRRQAISDSYEFNQAMANSFAGKHLLIIDDIITTGGTLIETGHFLLKHIPNLKLSIAAVAISE